MTPLFKRVNIVKLFILSLVVGSISVLYLFFLAQISTKTPTSKEQEASKLEQPIEAQQVGGPLKVDVVLERYYLDGGKSEEVVTETIWSMEDFWAQYRDWQLVDQKEGKIIFKQNVDDISPLLKTDGYFGISNDGILTIFKGMPPNSEEVIQSFFQIDIKKLESRQQEELKKGIPVVSRDHYIEVIESFKPLSIKQ